MDAETLRGLQAPLKQTYRDEPTQAEVIMQAQGRVDLNQIACRVDNAHGQQAAAGEIVAGLHPAAGGDGQLACSGDMLLQSLVACSGVTLAAVATAMSIPIRDARITAKGMADFRGTLGVDRSVPIGLQWLELNFAIDSTATDEQLNKLVELTERYCVVLQSLKHPASIRSKWSRE